ncbi:acyl transferase/acyl hydrolase/lysophospholipase [Radiomyces spectabilis]|uniref:acyl transferase/acyl hydrolase/lysophospholipase n=1 Tax=Radiomyces spectabilis TaxID=64574 RepID=UPI00221E5E94|nr:acyl transferase/acyl hydrolase/lysophospholipase [Radiomyces spectabilis]KAI8374151.1 acyl transferase/acyl hydrolase/lysophospholipase [Radiomyces spectabilis]
MFVCSRLLRQRLLWYNVYRPNYKYASSIRLLSTEKGTRTKPNETPKSLWASILPSSNTTEDTNEHKTQNTKQDEEDIFLSKLFSRSWSIRKLEFPDLPSVETINSTMARLYPSLTSQFKNISENYAKIWEFLTMEDFRKIFDEIEQENRNPDIHAEVAKDATVRESADLSQEEQQFIRARKKQQRENFAKFIGVDVNEVCEEDIPVVALASSGGGYRAMVGCAGYLKAMKETGLLDCLMYMSGVSGSCWTMILYYNALTKANTDALSHHIKCHTNAHFANISNLIKVINASPHNSKLVLQGAIHRYLQQNGNINFVDLFGLLMGSTLLTRLEAAKSLENSQLAKDKGANKAGLIYIKDTDAQGEDKDSQVLPLLLDKNEMKLSSQQRFLADGSQPMPIYCVVRHDVGDRRKLEDERNQQMEGESKEIEESQKKSTNQDENDNDADDYSPYQWFEFTPYDMGSEEINAWIPIWAFGRKFENGKNLERQPEQLLDILMGMFGSAFAASLVHFYEEVRGFLPSKPLQKLDETFIRYKKTMASYHPISPACFPNPFYKISEDVPGEENLKRPKSLLESKQLCLMDAGMDNNIPFYPLLREGRDVDVILAIDLSADIQTAPHFDRAEGYAKRRGIEGWPVGAGWPKENISDAIQEERPADDRSARITSKDGKKPSYALGSCTVFASNSEVTINPAARDSNTKQPDRINPITVLYFPFIVNEGFDPDFDPQTAEFCSTWNFVYTPEQIAKVTGLAQANLNDNIDTVRQVLKSTWERKRNKRYITENQNKANTN